MAGNLKINQWLLPIAWLYGLGVALRNKFFDWNLLPEKTFPVPIISIGNIAVGGTGKTPHTEYLIRLLSKKYKVAVLSRGYKRKTKGFILAGKGADSRSIGDEPIQMRRKFPDIVVAVDANRRRGIRNLLSINEKQKPDVILLDDAFQHRYVKPSLSILLTDSNRPFYDDCLLPAGRLREPPKNRARADWIICTKCAESFTKNDYRTQTIKLNLQPHQQLFFSSYRYKNLLPVFPEINPVREENLEQLKRENYSFLAVAALANPSGLIDYLNRYTADLQTLIYPDHHDFTEKNGKAMIDFITKYTGKNRIIVTSEKDAVRLSDNPFVPEEIKAYIYYLPIEVVICRNEEELFIQKIENHVTNFKRNRILA